MEGLVAACSPETLIQPTSAFHLQAIPGHSAVDKGQNGSACSPSFPFRHATDLSSSQQETRPQNRVSRSYVHPRGPSGHRQSSQKGPQTPDCGLIPPMPETRADRQFRPHQHLRRSRDFRTVRQKGCRINCGVFLFQILVRPEEDIELPGPRLGVVTSRRVGHAVARNRLRRQMREIFRHHQDKLGPAVDLVLVMRSGAVDLPTAELEARFLKAIDRCGVRDNAGP